MPLVFVHGVNVRRGEVYDREQQFRDRNFVEIFYKQLGKEGSSESILNPYWGDLGASLSSDSPFLPHGSYQMLWRRHAEDDALDDDTDEMEEEIIESDSTTPLLDLARTASLSDVIDVLWELADCEMQESDSANQRSFEDMAQLAQRALEFSHSAEGEQWLSTVTSDEQILERLSTLLVSQTTSEEDQGGRKAAAAKLIKSAGGNLRNRISETRKGLSTRSQSLRQNIGESILHTRLRLRQKAVSTTAKLFNDPLRTIFHQQCGLLIGDAFSYFSDRLGDQKAAAIAERVMESLRQAVSIKERTGDELIVIGHSMGGVILCDIVTCYGKDIPIDILITVGSQFPLFADLQMFPGISGCKRPIPRPDQVKRWINIFDPHDFLGYPASHIFEGVDDFHLPTYAIGGSAHANYFNRRSFYFQLARRLKDYIPVAKG